MKDIEAWLESNEMWLRLAYRLAVIAILVTAVHKLDRIYYATPELDTLKRDVDYIQRDVAKIKEKIDPERLVAPITPPADPFVWPKPPSR